MYKTESEIDFENPHSLFKYRAFDRHALQALVDKQIWLAATDTFNDPLDCKFQVVMQHTDQELLDHLNECAIARGEARRFALEDIPQERPNFERVLGKLREAVRSAGICCFVATPFEPSMWAHYADGHRGFCIEYERDVENDLGKDGCAQVEYVDQAFSVFAGLDFFKEPVAVVKRILTSKSKSWSREREWRLIRLWDAPPSDRAYRLDARIASVTFGLKMPRRDSLTIVRLLQHFENIQFFEMTTPQETLTLIPTPFRFEEREL